MFLGSPQRSDKGEVGGRKGAEPDPGPAARSPASSAGAAAGAVPHQLLSPRRPTLGLSGGFQSQTKAPGKSHMARSLKPRVVCMGTRAVPHPVHRPPGSFLLKTKSLRPWVVGEGSLRSSVLRNSLDVRRRGQSFGRVAWPVQRSSRQCQHSRLRKGPEATRGRNQSSCAV